MFEMLECFCFLCVCCVCNGYTKCSKRKCANERIEQNIYVQKVECWSFGNHDKAALLIVIAMSYTHSPTPARPPLCTYYTMRTARIIVGENYLLNSELLTHHTPCLCTPCWCRTWAVEKSGSLHLMNLNTKFDFEMCSHTMGRRVCMCVSLRVSLGIEVENLDILF